MIVQQEKMLPAKQAAVGMQLWSYIRNQFNQELDTSSDPFGSSADCAVYQSEGRFEAKLRAIWTDGKAEVGRVRGEERRGEETRGEERRGQGRREEKRREEKRREEKRREEKRREEKRRAEQSREEERRGEKKREDQRKEDAGARKGRKTVVHCAFPGICGSGSKSRLAKAAGAASSGQMRDEKRCCGVKHIPKSTCTKRCIQTWFWVASSIQGEMFIRDATKSGADILTGVAFWSIRSSGLLRRCCVAGAALRMN